MNKTLKFFSIITFLMVTTAGAEDSTAIDLGSEHQLIELRSSLENRTIVEEMCRQEIQKKLIPIDCREAQTKTERFNIKNLCKNLTVEMVSEAYLSRAWQSKLVDKECREHLLILSSQMNYINRDSKTLGLNFEFPRPNEVRRSDTRVSTLRNRKIDRTRFARMRL